MEVENAKPHARLWMSLSYDEAWGTEIGVQKKYTVPESCGESA